MSLGDGQGSRIIYDLETLTFTEVLRARLRGRFPRSRNPIWRWELSIVVLTFGLVYLGFIVGMATWPRFRVETMAIAFGMAGAIWPVLTLSRLQKTVKRLREEGQCSTELTPEWIIRRTLTRECRYRWVPGQKFLAVGNDVLIFVRNDEILWLPRRMFSSPEAIDSFLQSARRYHADAVGLR